MKPSIYNEYEALTPEAQDFESEIEAILRPVFAAGQERFNVRDIAVMIHDVVSAVAAEIVVRNVVNSHVKLHSCPDCNHDWFDHRNGKCAYTKLSGNSCGCATVKPNA